MCPALSLGTQAVPRHCVLSFYIQCTAARMLYRHCTIDVPPQAKMTPKAFIHNIQDICRSQMQHIVLPEVR